MLPVTISDKEYNLATGFNDLTLKEVKQFIEHKDDLNEFRLLSILSGISYETLINFDLKAFQENIFEHIRFISNFPNLNDIPRPGAIKIQGRFQGQIINKWINIPKDIRAESYFQTRVIKQMAEGAVQQSATMIDLVAPALACYIQPLLNNGKVDDKQIAEIALLLDSCKCVDVYPWGAFFLKRWLKFLPQKQSSLNTIQPEMKFVPESKNVSANTETSLQSTPLQKDRFGGMKKLFIRLIRPFSTRSSDERTKQNILKSSMK